MQVSISVQFTVAGLLSAAERLNTLAELMSSCETLGEIEAEDAESANPVVVVETMTEAASVFGVGTVVEPGLIPPAPEVDAETDDAGTPWTEGIHADNKAKTAKGIWRKRRGSGGAKKAPLATPGDNPNATVKEFQTAMGAVVGHDLDRRLPDAHAVGVHRVAAHGLHE